MLVEIVVQLFLAGTSTEIHSKSEYARLRIAISISKLGKVLKSSWLDDFQDWKEFFGLSKYWRPC